MTINSVTTTKDDDFNKTEVLVPRTVRGVVQPANKKRLNPDIVDWSLEYMLLHTVNSNTSNGVINMGDRFTHLGVTYKIVETANYSEYGYFEGVGEQIRNLP